MKINVIVSSEEETCELAKIIADMSGVNILYEELTEEEKHISNPMSYAVLDNTKLNDEGKEACVVRYADIAKWWSWAAEKTNCKLYIGQAFYRYSKEGSWANPEEIPNQLKYNQNYENILGTIFFTFRDFYREDCDSIVEGKKLLKKLWTKPAKSGY